jgi:hypothetical protein
MYIIFCLLIGIPVHADIQAQIENGDAVPASHALNRSVARFKTGNGGTCSATFLTPTLLLTAGHCTTGGGQKVEVRDPNGRWYSARVQETITHPEYRIQNTKTGTRVWNDIGLVRLKNALAIAVRPLKIRSAAGYKEAPKTVTVVGYGLDKKGGKSGTLRIGQMQASVEMLINFFNREGLYLTPTTDQVLCPGDSGGAVLGGDEKSKSIIGVNSLSTGCQGGAGRSMSEIAYAQKAWIQQMDPSVP